VVDQVCLVADVADFFEAIAAWDERHFFPILIDEPAWTLPFLRAFRPRRVVRFRSVAGRHAATASASPRTPAAQLVVWQAALRAVARAWCGPSVPDAGLAPAGAAPRWLGPTPPGLVLSAPESSMLAGAVALAAGRFEPLVHLHPDAWALSSGRDSPHDDHVDDPLSLAQAWQFARHIEARVSAVSPHHDQLGDDCDFLTIAGNWPFRYINDGERGPARGIHALDDLLGRALEGNPSPDGLGRYRRRWAFAGRLLGDPAASVARAMAALFLEPGQMLLWDTYDASPPWTEYSLAPAAATLGRVVPGLGPIVYRSGGAADLASWHGLIGPGHQMGLVWINSSGGPSTFSIAGGPGRAADLPGGFPCAVVMIHSFSAADPLDPRTLAGRWLAQGAFVYYGSVDEPFVEAFRTPSLVAEFCAAGAPLVAALRQGELEAFGRPWRLIYLGDPLYSLPRRSIALGVTLADSGTPPAWPPAAADSGGNQPERLGESDARSSSPDRMSPADWQKVATEYASWPVLEIARHRMTPRPARTDAGPDFDDRLLAWCQDAAIAALTQRPPPAGPRMQAPDLAGGPTRQDAGSARIDWLAVMRQVDRARLEPSNRAVHDELLLDALSQTGDFDACYSLLARIPPDDLSPHAWQALETLAMSRLAQLDPDADRARGFAKALALWDDLIRLPWPERSDFPAHVTARMTSLARADASRWLAAWCDRLGRASAELATRPGASSRAAAVTAAHTRVRAELDSKH
jgi:hypothetical protein